MKKIISCILTIVVLAACQSKKGGEDQSADSTATTSTEPAENRLTEAEGAEGWKLLFNGENMDGWRTYKNREMTSWEVVDGTLHCKPDTTVKRADILTVDQYADFDLKFDWKVAPGHNSGIMYRATEEFDQAYYSGPEYQIIDDKGYPSPLTETQTTGSNYDMHAAPADKPINAPGEWNTGRIVVKGNHVEHWLNGTKVVEYELGSDDWKKRKAASKWKDAKGYGASTKGHIDLQDHGGEVWFRNIKIKTL